MIHWTLSTAALLSLSALGASPKAQSGAELLGIWSIPILIGIYGLCQTIAMRRQESGEGSASSAGKSRIGGIGQG